MPGFVTNLDENWRIQIADTRRIGAFARVTRWTGAASAWTDSRTAGAPLGLSVDDLVLFEPSGPRSRRRASRAGPFRPSRREVSTCPGPRSLRTGQLGPCTGVDLDVGLSVGSEAS